jgi:hypothetical protein
MRLLALLGASSNLIHELKQVDEMRAPLTLSRTKSPWCRAGHRRNRIPEPVLTSSIGLAGLTSLSELSTPRRARVREDSGNASDERVATIGSVFARVVMSAAVQRASATTPAPTLCRIGACHDRVGH